ncbi:hypothetical protein C8J57DRAFT_1727738 [Mycena rebaudengoi]|nr:hypothetical protein C8J57DRAFT_1727738 [Mycena rebaudengoi]
MKFPSKASSLESCADVAPHTFQLVVMLFVAVAAAVPTEMLKREPAVPLNRRPGALFIAMPSVSLLIAETVPSRFATALATLVLVGINSLSAHCAALSFEYYFSLP